MSTRDSFTAQAGRIARRGFTLTELMLVIVIVAILASLTMTVQRSAVESTRRERTIATIRKIDAALTSAYEKYQYRKPDVGYWLDEIEKGLIRKNPDFRSLNQEDQRRQTFYSLLSWIYRAQTMWREVQQFNFKSGDEPQSVDIQFAPYILRTIMLRELLLIDFPDSLHEVNYSAHFNNSPVQKAYQSANQKYDLQSTHDNSRDGDISADLLYLVVMNTSPETRGTFLDRETADTNNNGTPEFIDGWGNPIRFIRWAPALPESNRQPTLAEGRRVSFYRQLRRWVMAGNDPNDFGDVIGNDEDIFVSEINEDIPPSNEFFYYDFDTYYPGLLDMSSDPFDPMGSMNGWLLTPLIYSAGPDQEYGLEIDGLFTLPFDNADVGLGDWNGDGEGNMYSRDNITNHNLE